MGYSWNNDAALARSLYIHVPFCEAKCPYCAFASAVKSPGDEGLYLGALESEMELRSGEAGALDTLYIGGGTPTALSPAAWERLPVMIAEHFRVSDGAEFTVEANPSSLSPEHAGVWANCGVSRVSVGVQSLNDERLSFLGRLHSSAGARRAVELCLTRGFSVSADMMFGLPGESIRDWAADIKSALRLGTNHISIYQLSAEPGTPFENMAPELPEGYAQYRYAQWLLPQKGLVQYETASFAVPGHESRHNLACWADKEYLGLGPSAWSFLDGTRSQNAKSLGEYADMTAAGSAAVFSERLEGERAARQAAVLALRTRTGIRWGDFKRRYGVKHAESIRKDIEKFPRNLVESDENVSRLTPGGMRVGNAIWSGII